MKETIFGIVCIAVTCILAIRAFWLVLKYNIHMFQLNGYKNREHMTWIRKFAKRQWVLYAACILGMVWILIPGLLPVDIIMWLWLVLIIVVFKALNGMSVKKKLVWTARVKRLAATIVIADLAAGAAVFFAADGIAAPGRIKGILLLVTGLGFISCVVANIINIPMEKAVNAHFINDAKRILASDPDMTVIGVTGSYGKTSVKYYLGELLSVKYNVLITPESYNTPMGVVRTVREHLKPGTEIFVCEMGARHVGDIRELCDLVHPDHGIITSIGPQHLDTFHTIDNIISTKYELADALPDGGMLFLNAGSECVMERADKYPGAVLYNAGRTGQYEPVQGYNATITGCDSSGTTFEISTPQGESDEFRTRLIGEHNVINVAGAIAVAHQMGIPLTELKIPVRRLKAVSHRLELIRRGDMCIIDDAYNSNPVGSRAALDTLAMFDGTKILITPGMVELGEREEEYNREFGRHAGEVCDYVLTVGRKRSEPIRQGALEAGLAEERVMAYDRLEDAFAYAQGIRCEDTRYILLENDLPDNY